MTYAPVVITAVDHTTAGGGTFTSVGHNLVTGGGFAGNPNGPSWGGALFAAQAAGGGLGVIPTGLAPFTTYWPIRVDSDHFKLASSNANAMSNNAVTFSDNGALPLSFIVGIPYELPRISAAGQMVFADDFNTEWQALKALHAHFAGASQSVWFAPQPQRFTIFGAAGIEQDPDKTKVLRVGSQLRFAATRTGSNGVLYPLELPVGGVISQMKIVYNRAGNALAFSIVAQDLDTGAAASSAQVLVNDSSTSGVQAATVNLFAVDGSGHPTGAAGALTARADRAYWVLAECTFTSGVPTIYGLAVNP